MCVPAGIQTRIRKCHVYLDFNWAFLCGCRVCSSAGDCNHGAWIRILFYMGTSYEFLKILSSRKPWKVIWEGNWPKSSSCVLTGGNRVCTGSSQRQGQVFSFPAGQGGPCCSLPISLELRSFSETRFPSPEGAAMNLWVFAVGWKLPPLCHHPSCAQHPWLWAWSSSISSNTWVSTEGEDFAFFPWQDPGSLKNTLLLKYKTIYDCL